MPRFMVERTFKDGLHIPSNDAGAVACLTVVGKNAGNGVTWVTAKFCDALGESKAPDPRLAAVTGGAEAPDPAATTGSGSAILTTSGGGLFVRAAGGVLAD